MVLLLIIDIVIIARPSMQRIRGVLPREGHMQYLFSKFGLKFFLYYYIIQQTFSCYIHTFILQIKAVIWDILNKHMVKYE